jgi:apolipoprotein N-acyltransferase
MLTLCQPPYNQAWLAPFALLPLLLIALRNRAPFRWGWLAGAVHFTSLVWFIHHTITTYGGISWLTGLALMLLLGGVLGLYFALFTWLIRRISDRRGVFTALVLAPFIWTAIELLRHFLITGFPWSPLGTALWQHPTLAAPASIGSVYLLSFMLAAAACWGALLLGMTMQSRRWPVLFKLGVACVSLILLATLLPRPGRSLMVPLRVRIVQPDIPQRQKWDPQFGPTVLKRLHDLATAPSPEGPLDLIVFPESSMPPVDQALLDSTLTDISTTTGAPLLLGSELDDGADHFYNAVVLLTPGVPANPAGGNPGATQFPLPVAGSYAKRHLVPFGEYVPWKKFLFFAGRLTHNIGEFTPGDSTRPLILDKPPLRIGALLCYESIFPDLTAQSVAGGSPPADLLVNLSNDAWYEGTGAKEQLLSMAVMRVIETQTPMIRSANSGISALITPEGITALPDHQPAFQDFTVEIPQSGSPTIAARYGMVLPWMWLGLGVIAALSGFIGKQQKS